jgi:undecaprenyl-diphosphatase
MRLNSRLAGLWRQIRSYPLELDVLVAIFALAAASFTFFKLLSEMREGETHSADQAILLALREPNDPSNPIGPEWLESIFRDLTSLGSPVVLGLITIAAICYLWIDGKRAVGLFVAIAIAGGAILSLLLKLGFARPRPELVSHLVNVNSFSFPSAHATMATITYLTLGVLLASVQCRRRIFLGVHWPTDVIAGWCIGTAWALGCWLLATWLQYRGTLERENASPVD